MNWKHMGIYKRDGQDVFLVMKIKGHLVFLDLYSNIARKYNAGTLNTDLLGAKFVMDGAPLLGFLGKYLYENEIVDIPF